MNRVLAAQDALHNYLKEQEKKTLLRFITCGSVDDGKSTLIGRLLYETKKVYADQLAALINDSKRYGSHAGGLDFSFLVDGLSAEQEQGITIDIAYRYFDSERRKYIIIDAPGHVQYTRNMVTGASNADVAVLLIDARYGITEQTKRHSFIIRLLGIKQLIVLINKMDLVDYSADVYQHILTEFKKLFTDNDFKSIAYIPISALHGDNITTRSANLSWYQGLSFLEQLDSNVLHADDLNAPFLMPVQQVIRPNQDFRGYAGRIISGKLCPGQQIKILPHGSHALIKTIHIGDKPISCARSGQSVVVQFDTACDASRGDVLVDAQSSVVVADQFQVYLVWLVAEPLIAGRHYILKSAGNNVNVSVTRIKHRINIADLQPMPAQSLDLNDIGLCNIKVARPIVYQSYEQNRDLGSFIFIDQRSNQTVAAGMIQFALRRAGNMPVQASLVTKKARALIKNQQPRVFWLTGLSGAGKSTIAHLLEQHLIEQGHHTFVLDGDNVRQGLCNDLGFTTADRVENVRRVAETAKLMTEAGLIVIVALISPYRQDRAFARSLFAAQEFVEVFVDVSLAVAELRDVKGLYAKASQGRLINFTGIDSAYEPPEQAEIKLDTEQFSAEECVDLLLQWLAKYNY